MTQAGHTDKIIDILKPSTAGADSFGAPALGHSTFISRPIWAEVIPLTGEEQYRSEQVQASIDIKFTMRYTTEFTVTPSHIVRYNGKDYNIKSVINVNDENRDWVLNCNKVTTA